MSNPQYPSNQPPYQPGPGGYPNQPPNAYPPQGYQQPGGYPPPQGFPPPGGYQQPGYPPQGYQQPGYPPPGYQQPGYPNQMQYGYGMPPAGPIPATFGQRFVAWLIDGIIIGIVAGILATVLIVPSIGPTTTDIYGNVVISSINGGLLSLGILVAIIIPFAYYIILVGRGQTVGDRVAGIKLVGADGNPPGYGKAFLRLIVQYFISGIFLIGYLWMLWDPNKQTLHDKLAGTFTVPVQSGVMRY